MPVAIEMEGGASSAATALASDIVDADAATGCHQASYSDADLTDATSQSCGRDFTSLLLNTGNVKSRQSISCSISGARVDCSKVAASRRCFDL